MNLGDFVLYCVVSGVLTGMVCYLECQGKFTDTPNKIEQKIVEVVSANMTKRKGR